MVLCIVIFVYGEKSLGLFCVSASLLNGDIACLFSRLFSNTFVSGAVFEDRVSNFRAKGDLFTLQYNKNNIFLWGKDYTGYCLLQKPCIP